MSRHESRGPAAGASLRSSTQFARGRVARVLRRDLNEEKRSYLEHSWRRYGFVLWRAELAVQSALGAGRTEIALLDVGPHFFTALLRERIPDVVLNTIGFADESLYPASIIDRHFQFDLNTVQLTTDWPCFGEHDVIVMGEVLEHLHTAPVLVIRFLSTLLRRGGRLIVSTPNAVSLARRVAMLRGRHPYEMLRESYTNPGHIREYTLRELVRVGVESGLRVNRAFLAAYFMHDKPIMELACWISSLIPSFREGITIEYDKP